MFETLARGSCLRSSYTGVHGHAVREAGRERDGLIRELNAVTNDVSSVRRLLTRMRELQGARARLTDDVRQARLRLDI